MQANPNPRKTILVDRDGTLIYEPPEDKTVSALEQLRFIPGVLGALRTLVQNGYALLFVTNQDGLGTPDNPRENYNKINEKIFELFSGEGIPFTAVFECPHKSEENCECRKPRTGMVNTYLQQNPLLLSDSFMIGDRATDCQFGTKLGISSFLLHSESNKGEDPSLSVEQRLWTWSEISQYILQRPRKVQKKRKTTETNIELALNLDAATGQGRYDVTTGIHFFDHMLEQFSRHGAMDLQILCSGDLEVDTHHTVEDVALTLGEAFNEALGEKRGIERYSWERVLVMDEVSVTTSLDLSGRPYCAFEVTFPDAYVGDLATSMVTHFFQSFASAAKLTLHVSSNTNLRANTHHLVEACFKSLARCLKEAVRRNSTGISSTKGLL